MKLKKHYQEDGEYTLRSDGHDICPVMMAAQEADAEPDTFTTPYPVTHHPNITPPTEFMALGLYR